MSSSSSHVLSPISFLNPSVYEKNTVYVSIDIETDGPSPIHNNIRMLAIAISQSNIPHEVEITHRDKWILETHSWCIREQPGHSPDPKTIENFQNRNPDLLKNINDHSIPIEEVITEFARLYESLRRTYNVIFVAKSAAFDWQWLSIPYNTYGPPTCPSIELKTRCISSMIETAEFAGIETDFGTTTFGDVRDFLHDAIQNLFIYLKLVFILKRHQSTYAFMMEKLEHIEISTEKPKDLFFGQIFDRKDTSERFKPRRDIIRPYADDWRQPSRNTNFGDAAPPPRFSRADHE